MSRQGSADPATAVLPQVAELRGTSSTASQPQTLPLSFSLRHNELADSTIPEKMVLKVRALCILDLQLLCFSRQYVFLVYACLLSLGQTPEAPAALVPVPLPVASRCPQLLFLLSAYHALMLADAVILLWQLHSAFL